MKKALRITLTLIAIIASVSVALAITNHVNASLINTYIDTFEPVDNSDRLTPQKDEYGYYFTTDGEFNVMHLTDVHLCGGIFASENDKKAINAVAAMISEEKPDLVVITGDISYAVPWYGSLNNYYPHNFLIRLMERLGVYWTVTFGNHDSESYNYFSRSRVADFYSDESLEYCLFDRGPEDITGQSNHAITVRNSLGLITQCFVMIDSNSYTANDVFGICGSYDRIHDDQIAWYEATIKQYNSYNASVISSLTSDTTSTPYTDFSTVKSMMFLHIPIGEVLTAYEEYVNNNRQTGGNITHFEGNDGENGKVVCCSDESDDLFEKMTELGSTQAMFFGHDHLNSFVVEYMGVSFSYGYSIDYSAYIGIAGRGYQRGCTVIAVKPDTTFSIRHENYYQDKYESLYEKESVDMSK